MSPFDPAAFFGFADDPKKVAIMTNVDVEEPCPVTLLRVLAVTDTGITLGTYAENCSMRTVFDRFSGKPVAGRLMNYTIPGVELARIEEFAIQGAYFELTPFDPDAML